MTLKAVVNIVSLLLNENNSIKKKNDTDVDMKKKTLGETKREMQENNKLRQNSEANEDNGSKIKVWLNPIYLDSLHWRIG